MLPHSHFYSFRHPALHSQRWCSTRVPMFLQWNIGLSALGFAPGACWPSWAGMTAPKFRPAVASRRRFRMGCSQVLGRLGGGTRLSTLAGRSAPRFSPHDRCLRLRLRCSPRPLPSSDACIHAFVRSRPASSLHAMSRLHRRAVAFAIAPHAVQDRCLRPMPSPSDQRRAFRSH